MSKILRVVMVEPHEAPYELNITDQLEDLQETVGGMIEVIGNGDGTHTVQPVPSSVTASLKITPSRTAPASAVQKRFPTRTD